MRANFNLPISHHSEPPPNAAAQEERRAVKLKLTRELGNIKPDKPLDELGKERAKDKELSREELQAILEKTAEISKIFNSKRKIKYEVIEEADLVQIQVIDTDDGKIIRKIPADEIVELVKKLHEVLSERLDVKA
ncbi:MAG: flagellar protein FlaG [Synergistaceae bacterium]|nr:flagellar protein FlaG [Synergistaceae bacterium]